MYFRVKTKAKQHHFREVKGILLLLVSFLLGYCLVLPWQTGVVGEAIAKIVFLTFGKAAFLIPLLIIRWGWMYLKPSSVILWRLDMIWNLLILMVASSFLSVFGTILYHVNYGGWSGLKLSPLFLRLFGGYLSLLITAALFAYLCSLLFHISLKVVLLKGWQMLVEDYHEWQKAREELRKTVPPRIKSTQPVVEKQVTKPEIKPEPKQEPKIIIAERPAFKPAPVIARKESKLPEKAASTEHKPIPFEYKLPPLDILSNDKLNAAAQRTDEHLANAELLTKTLADFNITAKVKEIIPGPVVTRYDIELAPGIKIQSVVALGDNLSLAMKSPSIRVVPVPEKSAVGVEVPNVQSSMVGLRGILASHDFQNTPSLLSLALGKTTDGCPYVTDLMPMPHLLIAGATGSGKSVCIHSLILSILYRARPDEVKFLLIDPKRLEMPIYRGLPHIYDPRVSAEKADIITQPKEAAESLKKLVRVMEKRYERFAQETVRNIAAYNEKMAQTGGQKEFYIVVIIDELADLMLIATKEVEDSIQRLAQMARAVGIHLVLATQRPSVDVITGVIKANFPARIAFQTTSKVDSRVILDAIGADALLGKGDMLFVPPGESRPTRLQGAFVSAKEAEQVVKFIQQQNVPRQYEDLFVRAPGEEMDKEDAEDKEELSQALKLVLERKRVSQDLLKAHFGSSARATNLLSLLETKGFIHKPEGTNRWTIYFDKIGDYLNRETPPAN